MDFITGKLLDSAIIGILCYICCSAHADALLAARRGHRGRDERHPLLRTLHGAFPSAFIILLVDPMKCLFFLVFILILQQFDGNISAPKILGSDGRERLG